MRLLLLNQVPSFVSIETGYDLKTAKLPGQCPFNRSQRPFGATKQLLGWNEHQSGRARDKVNHLHACMRVVTGCDILDLHGDPSGSSPLITCLDLFFTVALFQFSLFKSRKTNFNYFLQRWGLTCARQSMGLATLSFFECFFCLVPSSRSWLYSIKQRFYHWSIFARKATKVVFHSFCRGKLTVIRVASIFTWIDRGVCTARQTSFAAHLKVKTIGTFTSRVVRGFANS